MLILSNHPLYRLPGYTSQKHQTQIVVLRAGNKLKVLFSYWYMAHKIQDHFENMNLWKNEWWTNNGQFPQNR